jgi:hypothetical protein
VINGCKDYPERIYGDWLQNREKLDQKYFERLTLLEQTSVSLSRNVITQ